MGTYFPTDMWTDRQWIESSHVSLCRPWWPQRCIITKKLLWITPALCVIRIITGPGMPIKEIHWIEPRAYTLQCLKGWD